MLGRSSPKPITSRKRWRESGSLEDGHLPPGDDPFDGRGHAGRYPPPPCDPRLRPGFSPPFRIGCGIFLGLWELPVGKRRGSLPASTFLWKNGTPPWVGWR